LEGHTSPMLQLLSSPFLLLLFICFVFSPMWKRSHESHYFFTYNNILPDFTYITYIMDINHDGMGPFTPTIQSHSSSIALKFSYIDHLRARVDSQLFLSNTIRIRPPRSEDFGPKNLPRIDEGTFLQSTSSHTTLFSLQFVPRDQSSTFFVVVCDLSTPCVAELCLPSTPQFIEVQGIQQSK
jgi:hypothetical protein